MILTPELVESVYFHVLSEIFFVKGYLLFKSRVEYQSSVVVGVKARNSAVTKRSLVIAAGVYEKSKR